MTATLEHIAANVAREVSVRLPSVLVNGADETAKNLVFFISAACEEVSRRVDWAALEATTQLAGTGADITFNLPSDYGRLTEGASVFGSDNMPVRGGLSNSEWAMLNATEEGTPRYYHINGPVISFYPYLANADTVDVLYQSKNFIGQTKSVFSADDDVPSPPHEVIEKCAVYRWLRHVGQEYADYEAEYEATLRDYASFDIEDRTP